MPSITPTARGRKFAGSQSHKPATVSSNLVQMLLASGYADIRALGDQVCAVKQFNFTTAVVVGLDDVGYQRRYCYEHQADAWAALLAWDGRGHPSGPWLSNQHAGIATLALP